MLRPAFYISAFTILLLSLIIIAGPLLPTQTPSTPVVALSLKPSCNIPVVLKDRGKGEAAEYNPTLKRVEILSTVVSENPPLLRAIAEHECGHHANGRPYPRIEGYPFKNDRFTVVYADSILVQKTMYNEEMAADCYAAQQLTRAGDREAIEAFLDLFRYVERIEKVVPQQRRWAFNISHPPTAQRIAHFQHCAQQAS